MKKFLCVALFVAASGCSAGADQTCYSAIPSNITLEQALQMDAKPIPGDGTPPFLTNGILYSDSYCDIVGAKRELGAIGYPLEALEFENMELISEEEFRQSPLSYGILERLPNETVD